MMEGGGSESINRDDGVQRTTTTPGSRSRAVRLKLYSHRTRAFKCILFWQ